MECALVRQEADLSASWIDDRCNEITYEEMASVFDIAWEGSITNALLFMPGYIQKPILTAVFTVQELLEKVVPAISHLSIDYPDVFEMLCLNRFQEMFPTEACPHEVLPSFFTEKQRFGRCRGVQFADRTFKMAEAGGIRGHASRFKLKSCPQSEPTNFLLSTQVQGMILTVGLAVKTCRTVTAAIVDEEREKFDSLLSKKNGCLNVLFICATKYGGNLQAFGSAKSVIYTEGMQSTEKKATTEYIHEVILLDLTTPQNRAEFFGLAWDDTLQTRLENVIHKGGSGNTDE
ncbi:hypothetical protein DVH05_016581 [Phytophthora capsici]|nr:hypothetical protein DVH05_016581 [Phytophthora capsici]